MSYQPLDLDLCGRVVLVTGATSGMGKETARELARMGAHVILGCRSMQRAEATRDEIIESPGATRVSVMAIDLASLASVRGFAAALHERFAKLDVLVNNAAASLPERELTAEGFERQWATNVLGPHLLATLLLPALRASGHGRIVTVSTRVAGGLDLSDTQYARRRYRGVAAYRASKQAARMLTWALADELKDERVTANAVNPGYVVTPLSPNVTGPLKLLISLTSFAAQGALDGADTTIWAAASPELEGITGKFWNKRHEIRCRFRRAAEINTLRTIVEQQLADASLLSAGTDDRATTGEPRRQPAR
jgi:NAD(P)-dependent dehydrogenase (short-subunit alcohol dehydrogenase family)